MVLLRKMCPKTGLGLNANSTVCWLLSLGQVARHYQCPCPLRLSGGLDEMVRVKWPAQCDTHGRYVISIYHFRLTT